MSLLSADIFNFDFVKWELLVLAFLLLLAFVFWRCKSIKSAVVFLLVTTVLLVVFLLGKYLVLLAFENPTQAISLGVAWVPTVLFVFIIFFYTIFGVVRGLRKSTILWVQSIVIGLACLGLFFFCINSVAVDKFVVKAVNLFMGDGGIQAALDVSAECDTARSVLAEYLPTLFSEFGNEVAIVVADNGAYLMTLVDMAYRIVFAVALMPVYFLLEFIMYIVYLCAYPERKYKRRRTEAVAVGKADRSYRPHSVWGGVIGFLRGTAVGLVVMSMLGFVLYIGAGGTGDGKLKEFSFGNDDYDFGYSIYRSIESYGDQGIFKLLNLFKGTDDSPYYLFAADLIFSGQLEDENTGINETIKLRKELGAYSGFARDTMSLLLKYGEEQIKPILLGQAENDVMDRILEVMTMPAFQEEFETLIDGFEAQTYIINFALSAVNSIIGEIDNTRFADTVGPVNCDMLKVLFKPGYLSPRIPDEATGETGRNQPHINFANVFQRSDAKVIYRLVVEILTSDYYTNEDGDRNEVQEVMDLADKLIPQIQRLSLLDTDRASELDPVLGRLYCFLANVYLADEVEHDGDKEPLPPVAEGPFEGVKYSEIAGAKVKWVSELNALTTVALDGIELYNGMDLTDNSEVLDSLRWLFSKLNWSRARNLELYDNITSAMGDSRLVGVLFNTRKMRSIMVEFSMQFFNGLYIPTNIDYSNVYDSSGNFIEYGELYNVLRGMRMLLAEDEYSNVLDKIGDDGNMEIAEALDMLNSFTMDIRGYDKTLADYASDSVLLRSAMSTVLLGIDDFVCVPYSACDPATENKMIKKSVLKDLFDCLADKAVVEELKKLDGEIDAAQILKNDVLMNVLKRGNVILEGTVARVVLDRFGKDDKIVIPDDLKLKAGQSNRDIAEGWLTNGRNTPGEVRRLIAAVRTVDIDSLLGNDGKSMTDVLLETDWNEGNKIDTLLASRVLHYTVSDYILSDDFSFGDEFTLIVPNAALGEDGITTQTLVKQAELKNIISNISSLGIDSESDAADVLRSVNKNKSLLDSYIISASMANFIAKKSDFLKMPKSYMDMATENYLKENDKAAQMWKGELAALLEAIDALFDLESENLEFTDEALEATLKERILDFNKLDAESEKYRNKTRLDYCCDSDIILYNITLKLDESIAEWDIKTAEPNEASGEFENLLTADVLDGNAKSLTKCYDEKGNYVYMYKREELASLVYAAEIFGMDDLFGFEADGEGSAESLKQKVEDNMLNLNELYAQGESDTRLDKIYGSFIIRLVVSNEVDVAITEEMAVKSTRDSIKNYDNAYPAEEMSAVINALNVMLVDENGDSLEGTLSEKVGKVNFADVGFIAEHLDNVYQSKLVGACITKRIAMVIATDGSPLVNHVKAYMDGYDIYTENEVQCLLDIIRENGNSDASGGVLEFGNFELGSVEGLKKYVEAREFGSDEPKSYLVAASLSANIAKVDGMVIPMSAVYNGVIKPSEMIDLLNAYTSLAGDSILDDWSGIQTLPDSGTFDIIVKSEVVRATITAKIAEANDELRYVSANNAVSSQRGILKLSGNGIEAGGGIGVIAEGQLISMLKLLNEFGRDFTMPTLDVQELAKEENREKLKIYAECDMLRYRLSEMLDEYTGQNNGEEESVIDIVTGNAETIRALSEEDIVDTVVRIGEYM